MEVFQMLQEFQSQNMMASIGAAITKREPNPLPLIVDVALKHRDFKLPALVFGFKVQDKARVNRLLEKLEQFVAEQPLPAKLQKEKIGGGDYYTLILNGKMIPVSKEEFKQKLSEGNVGEAQAEEFYDWLGSQTLAVTLGFHDSYFLLSISGDNKHLERLGKGSPLGDAESVAVALPYLKKPNAIGLAYVSREFIAANSFDPSGISKAADTFLPQFGLFLPPNLVSRLRADARQLAKDLEAVSPKPSEYVTVSLLNRGIESYSFSKSVPYGVEFGRPISIIRHAGGEPFVAVAGNSQSGMSAYNTFVGYLKKLYGYAKDFGLPLITDEHQKEMINKVQEVVLPFLARIEEITRTKLLPSTDAGQTLFVLDTKMQIKQIPGMEDPLPKAMPMLELALAVTLKDSQLFKDAIQSYVEAIEDFVPKLADVAPAPIPMPFKVPRPQTKKAGSGEMYSYALPPVVDPAISPHAIVTNDLLILSMSPSLSKRMLEGTTTQGHVVDLTAPSGTAGLVHMSGFWTAAREWIRFASQLPDSPLNPDDPNQKELIQQHVDAAIDILGCFRGAVSRSYKEGDYVVTHSWAHFEDL